MKWIIFIVFLIELGIFPCYHAYSQSIDSVSVTRLSFNTRMHDEFSPCFCDSGLIFCSNRKNDVFVDYTTTENQRLLDIYFVGKDSKGKWRNPRIFSEGITTVYHEGPACMSSDYSLLYFTRNNKVIKALKNNIDPQNKLGIYTARNIGGRWQEITPFIYNDERYTFMHPSISADGLLLFFSSDMPGGNGGMDLYFCVNRNGKWEQPVNLGSSVNTPGNEVFPFIHSSGTLFFSSDGHSENSGLDIFSSVSVHGEWSAPILLKSPINTDFDDFGFIADSTMLTGFFTSNRNKSDDIFSFTISSVEIPVMHEEMLACDTVRETELCYEFLETETVTLDSTPLFYTWDLGDGTIVNQQAADHCYDKPGDYTITLSIVDTLSSDIFIKETTYYLTIEDIRQVYIAAPDSCNMGDTIHFSGAETNLEDFDIAAYFWDFGDGTVDTGAQVSHIFNKTGTWPVRLVVESSPDSSGKVSRRCGIRNLKVYDERIKDIGKILCENISGWDSCYVFFERGCHPKRASMEYEWDFGDGTRKKGAEAEHCFSDTGRYVIRLNVVDLITGEIFSHITSYELLVGSSDKLTFVADSSAVVNQEIMFDQIALHADDILVNDYLWVFSDGFTSYGDQVIRPFTDPGNYTVKLLALGINVVTGEKVTVCAYKNFVVKPER